MCTRSDDHAYAAAVRSTSHAPTEKIGDHTFSRCLRMAGVIRCSHAGAAFTCLHRDMLAAFVSAASTRSAGGRQLWTLGRLLIWLDTDFRGQRRTVTARTQVICSTRSVAFDTHTSRLR